MALRARKVFGVSEVKGLGFVERAPDLIENGAYNIVSTLSHTGERRRAKHFGGKESDKEGPRK